MAAAVEVEPVAAQTLADLPTSPAIEEVIFKIRLRELRRPVNGMMAIIVIFAVVVAWLSHGLATDFPLYWLGGLAAVAAGGGARWLHQEQLDRLVEQV